MSSFLSRFGGGSNASSRKSSIVDDPNKPVTTEIKTSPTPGYVAKNKPALTEDQEKQVSEVPTSVPIGLSCSYHYFQKVEELKEVSLDVLVKRKQVSHTRSSSMLSAFCCQSQTLTIHGRRGFSVIPVACLDTAELLSGGCRMRKKGSRGLWNGDENTSQICLFRMTSKS
jgi:hypothetical protein